MDEAEFLERYWKDGFVVLRNLISDDKINAFLDKHRPIDSKLEEKIQFYPTYIKRDEYTRSEEIRDILCSSEIYKYLKFFNKHYALNMTEARIGTSGIKWHSDDLRAIDFEENMSLGVHVALSDVDIKCGPFEIVPGSHKFKRDSNIINQVNCQSDFESCYNYNEELVMNSGIDPYIFEGKRGDVLIWHGHSIHRGGKVVDWEIGREVIFGHFEFIDDKEALTCLSGKNNPRLGYENGLFYVAGNYHE